MKTKTTILKTLVLSSLTAISINAWSGGSSDFGGFDATATCRGQGGEIYFEVMRSSYKGELLSFMDLKAGTIKMTDVNFINQLQQAGLIRTMPWDRRRFLRDIGVDPASFEENITTIVNTRLQQENQFLGGLFSGGTLDLYYTPQFEVHSFISDIEPTDIRNKRAEKIRVLITQLDSRNYLIKVSKLTSGQKVCVESHRIPNPWAGLNPNPDFPATIEVCDKYKTISEMTSVDVASTVLRIQSCQLSKK